MDTNAARKPESVKEVLLRYRAEKGLNSWNKVAKSLGINSAHISALFNEDRLFPRFLEALEANKLIPPQTHIMVEAPICSCGRVHIRKSCNHRRSRKRPTKFMAPLDDISAMLKLLDKHYPGQFARTHPSGDKIGYYCG